MKELLELIARSLVDRPDEVEVSVIEDGDDTRYEMRVARDDLGKVIGKQGRTARAIRTIVASTAAKLRKPIEFDIVE
jgi:predicted RNA-binding protein YlqC (UPF0109 family)